MQFNFWRRWMDDKRVSLKVLVERELRDRVEQAAKAEGITMAAWVGRTLNASLVPVAGPVAPQAGVEAMEAAFDSLDGAQVASYPGVMPLPPVAAAPMAEAPVMAPSIFAPQAPVTTAAAFNGHACAHLTPGGTAQYTRDQIQGTCSAQGGRVCHWASHVAKNCPVFRPRRVMTAPMSALR